MMYHTLHCNSTAHFLHMYNKMVWLTVRGILLSTAKRVWFVAITFSIWTPVVGEVLTVARETDNTADRFAIAVTKDDMIVGHVPREFSKLCWHFLRHGGTIACEVTGRRKRSSTSSISCRIRIAYRRHFHTRTILESHAVRCYRICVYALINCS